MQFFQTESNSSLGLCHFIFLPATPSQECCFPQPCPWHIVSVLNFCQLDKGKWYLRGVALFNVIRAAGQVHHCEFPWGRWKAAASLLLFWCSETSAQWAAPPPEQAKSTSRAGKQWKAELETHPWISLLCFCGKWIHVTARASLAPTCFSMN